MYKPQLRIQAIVAVVVPRKQKSNNFSQIFLNDYKQLL